MLLIVAHHFVVNSGIMPIVDFLFIPFLNILVHNMTRRQHLTLVILCLTVFSAMETLPLMAVTSNYVIWFSILYLTASYMRLYPIAHKHDLRFWTMATAISIFLAVVSVVALIFLGTSYGPWGLVSDSNRVLAVAVGVTSFMMFVNIKIPYSKLINTIAASTFGVLLIHANSDNMRQWLWKDVCDVAGHYNSEYFWLYILITPLLVFTVCIVIDHIRLRFLEQPVLQWADKIYLRIRTRLSPKLSGLF